jgi:hypothetical protein
MPIWLLGLIGFLSYLVCLLVIFVKMKPLWRRLLYSALGAFVLPLAIWLSSGLILLFFALVILAVGVGYLIVRHYRNKKAV